MNQEASPGWYVLYVKSRSEKKVFKLLEKEKIEAFLPLTKRIKQWSDRKKIIEEPLFKSYIFTYIKESKEFEKVKYVNGVCDFIRFGKKFAMVSKEEIANIKIMISAGLENIKVVNEAIRVGEKRIIQQGLLKGLSCVIVKMQHLNKIVVRVEAININITASLPSSYLQSLSYTN